MAAPDKEFRTFEEFWPYYLGEHAHAATRQMHLAGTGVALASLAAFAVTKRPAYLASALLGSYGPAWLSHAIIERNKPATFDYPGWSLRADLKMFQLWAEGKLDAEVERVRAEESKQTVKATTGVPQPVPRKSAA